MEFESQMDDKTLQIQALKTTLREMHKALEQTTNERDTLERK